MEDMGRNESCTRRCLPFDGIQPSFICRARGIGRDNLKPGDTGQHLPVGIDKARPGREQGQQIDNYPFLIIYLSPVLAFFFVIAARNFHTLHVALTNSEARELLWLFHRWT